MNGLNWGWLTSALEEGFSPRNVAMLLWAGLAVLTISLLILARTRWGQAKPLSKCVFLSLYAHFLLCGYAYTTQVILAPPPGEREPVIRITHISDASTRSEDDQLGGESLNERAPAKPWERLDDGQVVAPDRDAPQRQESAPLVEPTRKMEIAAPSDFQMTPTEDLPPETPIERPAPEAPRTPDLAASGVAAPPAEIEEPSLPAPQSTGAENPPQELPGAGELARAEVPSPSISPLPRPSPAEAPQELFNNIGSLQRLADALPAALADAARSELENLAASANDGGGRRSDSGGGGSAGLTELTHLPGGRAALGAALAAMAIPRRLADGAELPEIYRLRIGEGRALAARELGATPASEAAVESALQWLAAHQENDGRWSPAAHGAGREDRILGHDRGGAGAKAETGITALALLSFLGAGHTHLEGPYAKNVQRGLEFLLRSQRADGDLSGDAEFYARMYCHGMASLALSEALALSGDRRLLPPVERGVAFTLACQHSTNGGWRYQKGDLGDMSQFGWQVMSLKSAELAGVAVPQSTHGGMRRFLRSCSSGVQGGLASYRGGERVSRTMTAEALACRYFLDGEPAPKLRREAVTFLLEDPPQDGRPNFYYWYYGALALYQTQDEQWKTWNAAMQEQLLRRQRSGGDAAGSWDPDCIWGGYGGRVYTTALGCLCLEVYYRYLPITAN